MQEYSLTKIIFYFLLSVQKKTWSVGQWISESNEKILAKLEDARLNAIYDRSYARELSYQLETTMSLMRQIYNKTKNKDLKTFLEESYNNLEPIQKQFSDFNTVSS